MDVSLGGVGSTDVLLSIRPRYVESIMKKEKSYEFRKTIFRNGDVARVFIYSTSPVKRILGSFAVGSITEDSPENLWSRFGDCSGLTDLEFFDYFRGRSKGYAIKIEHLVRFDTPIDPAETIPGFIPPQSFQYLDYDIEGQTSSQLVS